MPGALQSDRVLLVEGDDDKHVVLNLLRGLQPGVPKFDIVDRKGIGNLVPAIGPEIKAPGRVAVGILVDANDNPDRRWQAISDRVRNVGINPPPAMDPGGTVIEGRPRVGIWLMPDNRSAGELEDFIARLIPTGDPVWPKAQAYIEDIPVADRKFAAGKIQRARIHAWLAAREEPRKMGAAIHARDLNAAAPLASTFSAWLRALFR